MQWITRLFGCRALSATVDMNQHVEQEEEAPEDGSGGYRAETRLENKVEASAHGDTVLMGILLLISQN